MIRKKRKALRLVVVMSDSEPQRIKVGVKKMEIIEIIENLLPVIASLLFGIITFVRTGNIKKGVETMKYRLNNYRQVEAETKLAEVEKENKKVENEEEKKLSYSDGQAFEETANVWKLDNKGVPVKTLEVENIQAMIDSSIDCALERVLAKFDTVQAVKEEPNEYYLIGTALDELTEAHTQFAKLKEDFGFNDNATMEEVEEYLTQRFEVAKKKVVKENKNEEKTIEQKSE